MLNRNSFLAIGLMTSRLRTPLIAMFTALAWSGAAFAQGFEASPISFDLGDQTDDAGTPLLIAAYEPPAGAVPSVLSGGADRGATIAETGFPSPSIILGRVEPGREADYGIETLLPDTVRDIGLSFDDVDGRFALREENPDLLGQLIREGHLDPPEGQLNAALQTELQRMNCYRSTIDGLWGRGSARSVRDYFSERPGAENQSDDPSVGLFREIIANPDVACEVPQAAQTTTRSTTTRSTTTRSTQRTTTAAPRPAAPKPAAPANRPKISSGGGIGVFR